MTTIAARIDVDRVVMAGDTAVSGGDIHRGPSKVWQSGRVVWGWAGRCVLSRWIAAHRPPPNPADLDAWADALRARAREIDCWDEGSMSGDVLIGYAAEVERDAQIYHVGCDGAVVEVHASSYAIGSGARYALGAMCMGADPTQAVSAGCMYDPSSRLPSTVVEALNA